VARRCLNHGVDQDAGDCDVASGERSRLRDSLDLCDHRATGVVCSLSHRQRVRIERLSLRGYVAVFVGRRPSDNSDVDRDRAIVEVLLAVKGHEFDDVIFGDIVCLRAVLARIYKRSQADVGDRTGLPRGSIAKHVIHHAERQVVCLDLV